MLHLPRARVVAEGGEEEGPALIQRTPEEQPVYKLERPERARTHEVGLANECQGMEFLSAQHLGATGAQARAWHVFDQIQQGEGEMPVPPRASKNVAAIAMIMRLAPEPSSDEGKRIH